MRRSRWLLILVFLLTVAPVFAGATLDRIVASGEIRVGMTGGQPPLNFKSKSGELIGYEVDLVDILAASMRVEAKLVVKPFAELLPALKKGEIDMIMSGMTITPERNTKVAFVGPYTISGKSILTKSSTLALADETEDINQETLRLTTLAGSTSEEFVRELLPKAKLETTPDYETAVKLVAEGKADALVADMEICLISLLRYPELDFATLGEPLTIEPIGIALPADDTLLANLVENYLAAIETTGLLEGLYRVWYEDPAWLILLP